jgi:hypothetical protein
MFVIDFIRELFQSRVQGVKGTAKGKAYNVQARSRGKAASAFNAGVDGSVKKVTGAGRGGKSGSSGGRSGASGKAAPSGQAGGAPETKGKKMGLPFFGKQGGRQGPSEADMEELGDAKTQMVNVAQFEDAALKPCVGWIVVMSGAQEGRDFRLVAGRNRIGTDADMEVVLTDPYVSSHHATIVFNDEGVYQISDAGSTNGTKVNGKRVMQAIIVDNDSLQIGHVDLRFKALY